MRPHIFLLPLVLSAAMFAQEPSEPPPHRSCMMCHVKVTVRRVDSEGGEKGRARMSSTMCMTCHDGQLAEEPNIPLHLAHAGREGRQGLNCLTCHDPHDRARSFRLLRSKSGPLTEQTAAIQFCRECHPEH